jgi:hypothetical protein
MVTSILIAKIIAVIYLSFGFGLLFNSNFYRNEIPKLLDNAAYLLLIGINAIIVGVLITQYHNHWVKNWTVIITIIGWIALIKGIFLLAFPKIMKFYKPFFSSDSLYKVLTPCVLIFGLVFVYFGFYMN